MNKWSKILIGIASLLILGISYLIITEVEFNVKIIELPSSANAKCLDGSNYRFQLIKGSGEGIDKFLLSFNGGGWCGSEVKSPSSTIEACRNRALTSVGKSIPSFSFTLSKYQRIYSSKEKYNPTFHNWNKIVISYCDGFGHQSNVDNYGLYFRGLNNTLGVLNYAINNLNFKQAESVIVTGFSAGGLAAMTWANYIDSLTEKKNNTYVLVDSGLFYNIPSKNGVYYLEKIMKEMMKYSGNNSLLLNSYCPIKDRDEIYKCFLPDYIIPSLKMPVLLIQNMYDSAAINSLVRYNCMMNKHYFGNCSQIEIEEIKKMGMEYQMRLNQVIKEHPNISVWMPKSFGHTFIVFSTLWDNEKYSIKNIKLMDMISNWYKDSHDGKKTQYTNSFVSDENEHKLFLYKDWVYYCITYNILTIPGL